ncbi:MAG TPA: hypothetical protein VMH20_07775 [Verrucomicrobiae bacterium]|nr:hypothetical protein [Verrucomicrobiae bacterium]
MKKLLLLLLLSPAAAPAQSLFDGGWIFDEDSVHQTEPPKPVRYLVGNGVLHCSDCFASPEINADGRDQKVHATSYWDTVSVRIEDAFTVEIIAKKAGKTMFTEVDTVSPDGNTLSQIVKDTTEAQPVESETLSKRVAPAPSGTHMLSGSWLFFKKVKSKAAPNVPAISYRCTAEGFSAWTPLGERYDAKFDGKFYPVEDDPGHTMTSVKLLSSTEVEITSKREEKIVSVLHLTVMPDGKSIHAVFENKENKSTSSYQLRKLP